jgi:hypothetical protein
MVKKSILSSFDIASLVNAMKLVFPTRKEVEHIVEEKLNKKILFIPTKDEFFTRMDKLSGEIQKVREEQTLHQGQHREINDCLDRLGKFVHAS